MGSNTIKCVALTSQPKYFWRGKLVLRDRSVARTGPISTQILKTRNLKTQKQAPKKVPEKVLRPPGQMRNCAALGCGMRI